MMLVVGEIQLGCGNLRSRMRRMQRTLRGRPGSMQTAQQNDRFGDLIFVMERVDSWACFEIRMRSGDRERERERERENERTSPHSLGLEVWWAGNDTEEPGGRDP
jgi:hypothetical protein